MAHSFLSVAQVGAHLRLDGDVPYPEQTLIEGMIESAVSCAEQYLNRSVAAREIIHDLDGFPAGVIALPNGDVTGITSISCVAEDGVTKTVTDYILSGNRLAPAYGENWPATRAQIGAVTITYQAGYGDSVPAPVVSAILLIISDLYQNRSGQIAGNIKRNQIVDYLLFPYRLDMGV